MAQKSIEIPEIGNIVIRKRRNTRSMRLRIDLHGNPSVTIPYAIPYFVAVEYVKKHKDWIKTEQVKHTSSLHENQTIGRLHTLTFQYDAAVTAPKGRVTSNQVVIRHNSSPLDKDVQATAKKTAIRALKLQARHFLPKRLHDIALREQYEYSSVSVKQLKGRWGSCNQDKVIVLNIFLMELPVELIDYVILHELAHTRVMHHGPDFWKELGAHTNDDPKKLRAQLKLFQPTIPAQSVS